jgi:hypothetical protein
MTTMKSILSHSPSIVTRKSGTEYILVPISNNIADMNSVFTLNETGAFIWDQIDGKKSVEDIIDSLVNEFEIDKNSATEDALKFIDQLGEYLVIK